MSQETLSPPTPRTSEEWWHEVKNNPDELLRWLENQFHGEQTAVERITSFAAEYAEPDTRNWKILHRIAEQEEQHAVWVGDLLRARGVEPALMIKDERYWDETLGGIEGFESGAAVAAHAEAMRLERIEVIAADEDAPDDIRAVFAAILPEERFHERAFREMAGADAMIEAFEAHQMGRAAIGLVPVE